MSTLQVLALLVHVKHGVGLDLLAQVVEVLALLGDAVLLLALDGLLPVAVYVGELLAHLLLLVVLLLELLGLEFGERLGDAEVLVAHLLLHHRADVGHHALALRQLLALHLVLALLLHARHLHLGRRVHAYLVVLLVVHATLGLLHALLALQRAIVLLLELDKLRVLDLTQLLLLGQVLLLELLELARLFRYLILLLARLLHVLANPYDPQAITYSMSLQRKRLVTFIYLFTLTALCGTRGLDGTART